MGRKDRIVEEILELAQKYMLICTEQDVQDVVTVIREAKKRETLEADRLLGEALGDSK